MEQADAATEGAASALAEVFDGELFPSTEDDEDDGVRDGEGNL